MTTESDDERDDRWCEDCGTNHGFICPFHGPIVSISDKKVESRAVASLPASLKVKDVDGVRQIVAREQIQRRTQFGPLEGVQLSEEDVEKCGICKEDVMYKVFSKNKPPVFLVTSDENHSNWMSLVALATTPADQNLVSYQFQGGVYFSATRDIRPEHVLKVFFAPPYATKLNRASLDEEKSSKLKTEKKNVTLRSFEKEAGDEAAGQGIRGVKKNTTPIMVIAVTGEQRKNYGADVPNDKTNTTLKPKKVEKRKSAIEPTDTRSSMRITRGQGLKIMESSPKGFRKKSQNTFCTICENDFLSHSVLQRHMKSHNENKIEEGKKQVRARGKQDLNDKNSRDVVTRISGASHTAKVKENGKKSSSTKLNSRVCEEKKFETSIPLTSVNNSDYEFITKDASMNRERNSHQYPEFDSADSAGSGVSDGSVSDNDDHSAEGLSKYSCIFCDTKCSSAESLKIHMEKWHENKADHTRKCYLCFKKFETHEMLQQHEMQHSKMQSGTCFVCGKRFLRENIDSHLNSDHNLSSYTCVICSCQKTSFGDMQTHLMHHLRRNECPKEEGQSDKLVLTQKGESDTTRRSTRILKRKLDEIQSRTGKASLVASKKRREANRNHPGKETNEISEKKEKRKKEKSAEEDAAGEPEKLEETLKCSICRMEFSSNEKYEDHMGVHISRGQAKVDSAANVFSCHVCSKSFFSKTSLVRHVTSSHKPKDIVCEICGFRAMTAKTLKEHALSLHPEVDLGIPESFQYRCRHCDKVFLEMSRLNKHMNVHIPNKFKCEVCTRTFSRSESLKYHSCTRRPRTSTRGVKKIGHPRVERDSEGMFPCPECEVRFESHRSLAHHLFTHQKGEFECDFCQMKFIEAENLRLHRYIHHKMLFNEIGESFLVTAPLKENLSFPCFFCTTYIKKFDNVSRHGKTQHNKDIHPCCICCLIFETKQELMSHFNEHRDVEVPKDALLDVHGCDVCFSVFFREKALHNHKRKVHDVSKEHMCDYCGKLFKRKDVLDTHVKTHTQRARSECEICGEKVQYLKRHMLQHSEKKNFQCGICSRFFAIKTHLTQHLRVHLSTNSEAYECSSCSSQFNTYRKLLNHKKETGHGGIAKNWKAVCQKCGQSFTSLTFLQQHEKITHTKVVCPMCGKELATVEALKAHLKDTGHVITTCEKLVEATEKTAKCDTCDQNFKSYKKLLSHTLKTGHKDSSGEMPQSAITSFIVQKDECTEGVLRYSVCDRNESKEVTHNSTNKDPKDHNLSVPSEIPFDKEEEIPLVIDGDSQLVSYQEAPVVNDEEQIFSLSSETKSQDSMSSLMKVIKVVTDCSDTGTVSEAVAMEAASGDVNQVKVIIEQQVDSDKALVEAIARALVNSNSGKDVVIEIDNI